MFSSVIVQTLLVHTIFVWLARMCNTIYKETWYSDSAHVFCIHFVNFKRVKTHDQKSIFAQIFCTNTYIVSYSEETKNGKGYIEYNLN